MPDLLPVEKRVGLNLPATSTVTGYDTSARDNRFRDIHGTTLRQVGNLVSVLCSYQKINVYYIPS